MSILLFKNLQHVQCNEHTNRELVKILSTNLTKHCTTRNPIKPKPRQTHQCTSQRETPISAPSQTSIPFPRIHKLSIPHQPPTLNTTLLYLGNLTILTHSLSAPAPRSYLASRPNCGDHITPGPPRFRPQTPATGYQHAALCFIHDTIPSAAGRSSCRAVGTPGTWRAWQSLGGALAGGCGRYGAGRRLLGVR